MAKKSRFFSVQKNIVIKIPEAVWQILFFSHLFRTFKTCCNSQERFPLMDNKLIISDSNILLFIFLAFFITWPVKRQTRYRVERGALLIVTGNLKFHLLSLYCHITSLSLFVTAGNVSGAIQSTCYFPFQNVLSNTFIFSHIDLKVRN